VYLAGLNDPVRTYLDRAHIIEHLGEDRLYWSAYEAIMAADRYRTEVARKTGEYQAIAALADKARL
jgi:hypothetical protein